MHASNGDAPIRTPRIIAASILESIHGKKSFLPSPFSFVCFLLQYDVCQSVVMLNV